MNNAGGKVLVTGATGKTGSRLVDLLKAGKFDYLAASRHSVDDSRGVVFDWTDPVTYDGALEGVGSVYLVSPGTADSAELMISLCREAISRGATRIVLLSGSLLPEGGPHMGQVHSWLKANAAEWAVLRPSWFMQNFIEGFYLRSIRAEGLIYSGTSEGRVGFVNADDIAKSAFGALTMAAAPNRDFVLTGPEALNYDQAAAVMAEASGRSIRHVALEADAFEARLLASGFSRPIARTLAGMDRLISRGAEDRTTDDVLAASGAPPSSFAEFAAASAGIWSDEH